MSDYTVDKNGNRVMSPEYIKEQEINYLKAHNLYPLNTTEEERLKYAKILLKTIKWGEPALIYYNKNISKSIYATILALLNRKLGKFISYDVTSVNHLCHQYLSGEYHDLSEEFDYAHVLFVNANISDTPHMYNAYCLRNIATERMSKGKLTFIFFQGKLEDLVSDVWSIDEEGLGSKGVSYNDKSELVDRRKLSPITKYIKCIDLNERLK